MFELFNTNTRKLFKINNYGKKRIINIINLDNKYLSCYISDNENRVEFYSHDDNSNRQKWIIERDRDDLNTCYIKTAFESYNYCRYLGCPNTNNQVFLYTTPNNYTKWRIEEHIEKNIYLITYIGEKFNKNEISLVVARYNENINWVLAYNDIAIIYNKGKELNLPFNNVQNIENIGREGHTYLYHIINNYNNLYSKTIFTQASPFEHNNRILFGVDNYYKMLDIQPLGLIYSPHIPEKHILNNKIKTNYGLEYLVLEINENIDYINKYYFHDDGIKNIINTYKNKFTKCKSLVDNFLNRSNFPRSKNIYKIRFTFCGLFSVIKQKILKYDIQVYKNLLNELTSYDNQGGENGYILERLWLYIFED